MWRGATSRALSALSRPSTISGLHVVLSARHSSSKPAAASAARTSYTVSKDVAEYWDNVLEKSVDKPTARALVSNIDVHQILGLRTPAEGEAGPESGGEEVSPPPARRGPGGRRGRPPLYTFFASIKKQYPKHVTLVRVGEFYETIGIDAVLLVQHAGLNPMGSGVVPRAGCPRVNLRRTVSDLVAAGLSVVVCEEAPEPYSYGSMRTKQKERYVAAVVSPATPHLLHGLVDDDADLPIDAAPPLLALVPQVGGYTVVEVSVELQTVTVMEGLTEDAVYARLHEGGLAPPLFLHVPPSTASGDLRLSEGTYEREWEQRVAAIFRSQVGVVERYSDQDWLNGLLNRVRVMLGLPAATPFNVIRATAGDRPRPLYYSTALNLGLHRARGQPCLLDYLLPQASPLPARRWLRRLLLLPPPPDTAAAVHRVCATLAGLRESLPSFPLVPAASVVLKLRSREANDTFFRELGELCHSMLDLLARSSLEVNLLAGSLLEVASREMGVALSEGQLRQGCAAAAEAIHKVVDHDTLLTGGQWAPNPSGACPQEVRDGMYRLILANEGPFRGKVREEVMPDDCEAVAMAAERVQRELTAAFAPLLEAHGKAGEPAKLRPSIFFDSANNALWLRVPKNSAAHSAGVELVHPYDRNGRLESSAYATHGLQAALDDYRRACYDAAAAVRKHLRQLATSLQAVQTELVCAATMGIAAAALDAHTREALRRGWRLPTLTFTADDGSAGGEPAPWDPLPPQGPAVGSAGGRAEQALELVDFWPYWLDGWDPATVHNSLTLEGMSLLTGPNMAGKSTILRSVCAVALLGACGLYAPAAAATLPYFDAFMLRNFSSDSPLEGRSSFAVEMTEMRYVLEDLTPNSLVLVDELGKGTEVRAGSSLAGALMEALDASRCRGVFATHLHSLLDLDLRLANTQFLMMETAPADDADEQRLRQLMMQGVAGEEAPAAAAAAAAARAGVALPAPRKPTWRVVPGVSTESLALDVARRCRLPPAVVARAAQLFAQLVPMTARLEGGGGDGGDALPDGQQQQQQQGEGLEEGEHAGSGANGSAPRGKPARGAGRESQQADGVGGEGPSPWTLHAAADTLQEVAREALANCSAAAPGGEQQGAAAAAAATQPEVRLVLRGQAPPPATAGESCAYVLRRADGHFYAGSTESLFDRMRSHRQRTGKGGGRGMELAYVSLGRSEGASSLAKAVESGVIRELERSGFPMLSTTDARRRHVAGAAGTPASSL